MAEACDHQNATKIYTRFLYKALAVSLFLITVSFLPSQAPEFINQTLKTRGWEFLHLLFVGVAVSYGLFSGRTEGEDKEGKGCNSTFEYAHSFLARFLPSSSVFGDGDDPPPASDGDKVEAWSIQYCRNDAVDLAVDGPLLLPVRRLKSHSIDEDRESDSEKEEIVYPAPSPWKSLASKMEIQETEDDSKNAKRAPTPPPLPPRVPLQTIRKSVSLEPRHFQINDGGFVSHNLKRSNTAEFDREENWEDQIEVAPPKIYRSTYIPPKLDDENGSFSEQRATNLDNDEGPDVDKKADEFIARFREQIRLQRIESIKQFSISQSTVKSPR